MVCAEAQMRQRARERGLDWDTLDDAGRETLVNRLLHETLPMPVRGMALTSGVKLAAKDAYRHD